MEAVQKLENLGYRLEAAEGNIKFEYIGPGQLDRAQAKPFLEALKANKQEALDYLQTRKERDALVQDMFHELGKLAGGLDGYYRPGLEKRITHTSWTTGGLLSPRLSLTPGSG